MALAVPQLQWSIDQSAGSLFSIGRRFIEAATSDNVQMLALMTCESFGATLPVSTITRLKIETLARRNTSHTIDFLRAQIGYRAGDSADALSRSDGGVRFLCLAALLCSLGTGLVPAAQALDKMIRDNCRGEQRCPTMLQLRDLLQALSPKLSNNGFTADVIGWTMLCAPERRVRNQWQHHGYLSYMTPGYDALQCLLEAIQRCYRVGDSDVRAVVKADLEYIPWTIAVVKWLTGVTPLVKRLDGSTLLDSTDGLISVEQDGVDGRYLVSLLTCVQSVDHIVSTRGHEGPGIGTYSWLGGFLTAQSWLNARLEALDIDPDLVRRVLGYVVTFLPDTVLLCESVHSTATAFGDSDLRHALPRPFPSLPFRKELLKRLFQDQIPNPSPDVDHVIHEIHQKCSSRCTCREGDVEEGCDQQNPHRQHNDNISRTLKWYMPKMKEFVDSPIAPGLRCLKERIGSIIADVLALLLFTDTGDGNPHPELSFPDYRTKTFGSTQDYFAGDIQIYGYGEHNQYQVARTNRDSDWHALIVHGWWRILTGRWQYLSCSSQAILRHVGQIMGHYKDSESYDPQLSIVLSRYGRVVYPLLLDAGAPTQEGFLRLVKRTGQLWWNDQSFSGVAIRAPSSFHPLADHIHQISAARASMPCRQLEESFVPTHETERRLTYHVGVEASTQFLEMYISYGYLLTIQPWDLLYGASQTVFSPPCAHDPRTTVGQAMASEFSSITQEGETRPVIVLPGDKYMLRDHRGKGSHQLVQLAVVNEPCLLFSQGCIRCALTFAKQYKIRFVIC